MNDSLFQHDCTPDRPVVDTEFVCCSVIEFGDGGAPSVQLLTRGSHEECEKVVDLLPAVCYSGDRHPITESYLVVTEAENYQEVPA